MVSKGNSKGLAIQQMVKFNMHNISKLRNKCPNDKNSHINVKNEDL